MKGESPHATHTFVWPPLIATVLAVAITTTAAAGKDIDGRQLYLQYCAACHGFQGKGDGPDADVDVAKPPDLRDGFLENYSVDELVRRIRDGPPQQLMVDVPTVKVRASRVNALATHIKRLPSINWEKAFAGWRMYTARCVACHGSYGVPSRDLPAGVRQPRDLSDPAFQRTINDRDLMSAVRHGRQSMPALVPRVPESAGPQLVAFVRLLSPGFEVYSRYCASCHGDDGLAANHPPGNLRMPQVKFDRSYVARTDPERLEQEVWHMTEEKTPAMPHYRSTLTDAEARAIVEHLKASHP